jgi:hypothetical protein
VSEILLNFCHKINDDDDDHIFLSMMSTRVEPNIEPDNIWDYLKLLGFDHRISTVGDIDMEEDNMSEEEEEENDDIDDDQSFLSDMEENDVILETPPFSDDDDSDDDLYLSPPLFLVLVHTPNVSDEE